jgi:hypothetical protein
MKEQLLNGAIIELTDTQSENELMVSFSKRLNKFVLELNGSIIHTSKTFSSIKKKIEKINI